MHLHEAMGNTGREDTNSQGMRSKGLLPFPRAKKKILDSLNKHSVAEPVTGGPGGPEWLERAFLLVEM